MSGYSPIRKVLTAMLAVTILLWAEAGLALIAGDRVMACHTMMLGGQTGMMAAADDAGQESDAMPCCPEERSHAPAIAANHPPCCSVSNDAERPLAFLIGSERVTPDPLHSAVQASVSFVPQPVCQHGQLLGVETSRFVRPILELKTDLRI